MGEHHEYPNGKHGTGPEYCPISCSRKSQNCERQIHILEFRIKHSFGSGVLWAKDANILDVSSQHNAAATQKWWVFANVRWQHGCSWHYWVPRAYLPIISANMSKKKGVRTCQANAINSGFNNKQGKLTTQKKNSPRKEINISTESISGKQHGLYANRKLSSHPIFTH